MPVTRGTRAKQAPKTTLKTRTKKALATVSKGLRAQQQKPKPVVDKEALRIMRKIEKRVRQFQDHVESSPPKKRGNMSDIRVIHAKELLTIVKMMRDAERDGWVD